LELTQILNRVKRVAGDMVTSGMPLSRQYRDDYEIYSCYQGQEKIVYGYTKCNFE